MKIILVRIVAIFALLFAFSCASSSKSTLDKAYYSQRSPKLDVQKYFDGNVEGYGFVQDEKGRVVKTFSVRVQGEWEENKGIIKEYFVFDDNKKDSVVWIITLNHDGSISAIAHDIIGSIKGGQYGSAAELSYVLSKKVNGVETKEKVYDTFFALNNESLVKMSYSKNLKTTTFYKKVGGKVQNIVEREARPAAQPVFVPVKEVVAPKEEVVVKPVLVNPDAVKPVNAEVN